MFLSLCSSIQKKMTETERIAIARLEKKFISVYNSAIYLDENRNESKVTEQTLLDNFFACLRSLTCDAPLKSPSIASSISFSVMDSL